MARNLIYCMLDEVYNMCIPFAVHVLSSSINLWPLSATFHAINIQLYGQQKLIIYSQSMTSLHHHHSSVDMKISYENRCQQILRLILMIIMLERSNANFAEAL
jgi:hypothetical protein